MATKSTTQYTCDKCKKTKATGNDDELPKGWLHVSTDGFIDRTWDEHDVCPACVTEAVRKMMAK